MDLSRKLLFVMAFAFIPTISQAHVGHGEVGEFVEGVLHPLLGLDHVIAAIMVGMLSLHRTESMTFSLASAFLAAIAVGMVAGVSGLSIFGFEAFVSLTVVALGISVASKAFLPKGIIGVVVPVFGLVHGYAHGINFVAVVPWISYSIGVIVGTALLVAGGLAVTRLVRPQFVRTTGVVASVVGVALTLQLLLP
jgi:urease accessory protein